MMALSKTEGNRGSVTCLDLGTFALQGWEFFDGTSQSGFVMTSIDFMNIVT